MNIWDRGALLAAYSEGVAETGPCERFVEIVTDRGLEQLGRTSLVVLAPEAFSVGVADRICADLAADGFRPLACVLRDPLTRDETAAMFVPGWVPRTFRWWLVEERYALGPSALVLLTHEEDDASARLIAWKGDRIPATAHAESLRKRHGALNGLMNLFHTADEPIQALRNALPIVGAVDVARSLEGGDYTWGDVRRVLAPWTTTPPPKAGASFLATYLRLLAKLAVVSGESAAMPAGIGAQWADALTDVADHIDKPRAVAELCRRLAEATHTGTTVATEAIRALVNIPMSMAEAANRQWDRAIELAKVAGVTVDAFDRLLLISTLYYLPEELPEFCEGFVR